MACYKLLPQHLCEETEETMVKIVTWPKFKQGASQLEV
jgi:hypothetical protein